MIDLLEGSTEEAAATVPRPVRIGAAASPDRCARLDAPPNWRRRSTTSRQLRRSRRVDRRWRADSAGDDDIDAALVWKPCGSQGCLPETEQSKEAERIALEALDLAEPDGCSESSRGRHCSRWPRVLGAAGREEEALAKARAALRPLRTRRETSSPPRERRRLLPEHVPPSMRRRAPVGALRIPSGLLHWQPLLPVVPQASASLAPEPMWATLVDGIGRKRQHCERRCDQLLRLRHLSHLPSLEPLRIRLERRRGALTSGTSRIDPERGQAEEGRIWRL